MSVTFVTILIKIYSIWFVFGYSQFLGMEFLVILLDPENL